MFRFTRNPSSGSHNQYLAKITHLVKSRYVEAVQDVVSVVAAYCDCNKTIYMEYVNKKLRTIYILHIQGVQEECARLREGVSYVKVYRYNPKHLCQNLNGYGDNGQRSLKL